RKVRPQNGLAYPTEVGAQNAGQFALGFFFVVAVFIHYLPERQRLVELHVGAAAVNQNDQKFLQATGDRPGVGKQQLHQRFLFIRRPPPEQRHWNNLHILVLVFKAEPHQFTEFLRGHRLLPSAPKQSANSSVKKEKGVRRAVFDRQGRRGSR